MSKFRKIMTLSSQTNIPEKIFIKQRANPYLTSSSLSNIMYSGMSTAEREKLSSSKSPYGGSRIPRAIRPYLLLLITAIVCLIILHQNRNSSYDYTYGIMFDAGSTGSRIHVYKFHKDSKGFLRLDDELFKQVKPGLSSFPDNVQGAKESIDQLIASAKEYIPVDKQSETPVALKASAGLRILGNEKSVPILEGVGKLLESSPFVQKWKPEIMEGDKEAVYAWVTLNYLAKVLGQPKKTVKDTFGTLDLGGGSTQIAFAPRDQSTIDNAPANSIIDQKAFGDNFSVYIHSYLGFGLMSFRQQMLGGSSGENIIANSKCFSESTSFKWENARTNYEITGLGLDFNECYNAAKTVLSQVTFYKPDEIKNVPFYAFSYYFDRANEVGLISNDGGEIKVGDFKKSAEQVCDSSYVNRTAENIDWLCADLSIISALLIDGFGFDLDNNLRLYKKIDGIETQWSLGATFALFES